MTFFTLVLIAVIILAVIGLGWNTFVVAVIDGFDRTLDVGIPIIKNLTQEAQATTIEVPTYDPPMSHGSEVNGTRLLDYIGNEETSFLMVPWHNFTISVDVSDYNDCVNKPGLL